MNDTGAIILAGVATTTDQRAELLERIRCAREDKAPWMTLGAFLLTAARTRSPASPAGLLATIEDWALAELCESLAEIPHPEEA